MSGVGKDGGAMTRDTDLIRRGDAISWCDKWIATFGAVEIRHTSAREYALDAVKDLRDALHSIPAHPAQEPPSPGVTAGGTREVWDDQPVGREVGAELSGIPGELIDKMAEAIRGDTTSDDTPWATLSEDRKIGWRGDAERALAVVKEYLTARRPSEQAVTEDSLFDVLRSESWDLRCFDIPTGQGDADIGWRVVGHFMAKPHERTIAEVFHDDPKAALNAAMEAGG